MIVEGDPDHPILSQPWKWELQEFTYRCDPEDWRASYIDLTLTRDGFIRRLQFIAPQDLELSGVPNTSGMCILDVSQATGRIASPCACFEQSYGTYIWAARVFDLDNVCIDETD